MTPFRGDRTGDRGDLFQTKAPPPLSRLPALAVDFQATGPDPSRDSLLEAGWARVGSGAKVESSICRLPDGVTLERRIERATGLTEQDVAGGVAIDDLWTQLREAARPLADAGGKCPVIIHYARFEERFLRWLHYHFARDAPFPFRVVCTHRIAKRLFPELPRQSLRAVAGFFGHPLPELRRAGDHTAATCTVWARTVEILEATHGVCTLPDLFGWLDESIPRPRVAVPPMRREAWADFPDRPGVYRMLRDNGDVLYVGKATSLRSRVRSYFGKRARHTAHIREMLSQAAGVDVVVTASALEAALEETDAIKRYRPPYNKALRARDRRLCYASRDLTSFSEHRDDKHSVGPLIGHSFWRVVPAMASEDRASHPEDVFQTVSVPDATFERAVRRFRERSNRHGSSGARALLALGAELWRARSEEHSLDNTAEFELESPDSLGASEWSAKEIQELLEDMTLRAAHLVRRAQWLRLISTSRLMWISRDGEVRHVLFVERGGVRERRSVPLHEAAPTPAVPRAAGELNLADYDRLVVLTRELRRLVREGRDVSLQLPNAHSIGQTKLASMLSWV